MKILESRIIDFPKEIPRCSPTTFDLLDLSDKFTESIIIKPDPCMESYTDPKGLTNRKAPAGIEIQYWKWESDFSRVVLGFIINPSLNRIKLIYSVVDTFDYSKVTPALIDLGIERVCMFFKDLMTRTGKNIYGVHEPWLSNPMYEAYWKRLYKLVAENDFGIESIKYDVKPSGIIHTEWALK